MSSKQVYTSNSGVPTDSLMMAQFLLPCCLVSVLLCRFAEMEPAPISHQPISPLALRLLKQLECVMLMLQGSNPNWSLGIRPSRRSGATTSCSHPLSLSPSHIITSRASLIVLSCLSAVNSYKMRVLQHRKLHFSLDEQLCFIPVPYVSKQD